MYYISPLFWLGWVVLMVSMFTLPIRYSRVLLVSFGPLALAFFDLRSLFVFFTLVVLHYVSAIVIEKSKSRWVENLSLLAVVFATLANLFFFKFSFQEISHYNYSFNSQFKNYYIPMGLSFYSFQLIAYTSDVFLGRTKAVRSPFSFLLFSSFFAQFISGPIERAGRLLPQLKNNIRIQRDTLCSGFFVLLIGLSKKFIIADPVMRAIHTSYADTPTFISLPFLSFLTFVWIYVDLCAYSDICLGLARMLNIELIVNVRPVLFAKNVRDYWQRWHISFTLFVKDYLYGPILKLFRPKKFWIKACLPIPIMTIIGAWHGISLNWVLFFFCHGIFLAIHSIYIRIPKGKFGIFTVPLERLSLLMVFLFSGYAHQLSNFPYLWSPLKLIEQPYAFSLVSTYHLIYFCLPYLIPLFVYDFLVERVEGKPWKLYENLNESQKIFVLLILIASLIVFSNLKPLPFLYYTF